MTKEQLKAQPGTLISSLLMCGAVYDWEDSDTKITGLSEKTVIDPILEDPTDHQPHENIVISSAKKNPHYNMVKFQGLPMIKTEKDTINDISY
jgi:hypothetical protein